MKIKDLPKSDRPREKLEKYGSERLSDSELLAILLRAESEGVNVVEMANKILKKFSGVRLAKASVKELKSTLKCLGSTERYSRQQKGAFCDFLFGCMKTRK